ncbi:hypothetical protein PCA31118_01543 [Pandoraea captiosa]|uniref:Uncharacterized protein n=1 Tax=Pandoraea captiosa TaxID=2508302 RepID=A0A5E4ZVC6_9BURK|nr:hypothetical protein [Pandoraea captiosa]VVE64253.1 hypothetical protein PCA31118_01543 [Pandoraea captiosa]
MPHISHHIPHHIPHHRARYATPRYGLPLTRQRRDSPATAPGSFTGSFRHAGLRSGARKASKSTSAAAGHVSSNTPPSCRLWPATLAVLLVANLTTPASGAVPRRHLIADTHGNAHDPANDHSLPQLAPAAMRHEACHSTTGAPDDVDIRPVERPRFRSDYTLTDLLRIVAASRSPFEKLGESLGDAYEVFTGDVPAPETRAAILRGGMAADIATGIVPQVRMARMPGDISHVALRQVEGHGFVAEDLSTLMQALDPRTWRADIGSDTVAAPIAPGARRAIDAVAVADAIAAVDIPDSLPEMAAPDVPDVPDAPGHDTLAKPRIEGEREHLAGYEQSPTAQRPPADRSSQPLLIDGHHYLLGENGYYRVSRGTSESTWLVDAPRHDKAQVPVTFDPLSGHWRANPPLRLCGGGCGQSKRMPESDSIVDGWAAIASTISHLPDLDTQDAIQAAFGNLSSLRLLRGNRVDLRPSRDYSIVGHRAALRKAMRNIDRDEPLLRQQEEVAAATAMYYSDNPLAEAFCQENAEILFHLLLESGVPETRIRMITFQPKHRPAHVMVLYTESETFIDMLHVATPQPLVVGRPDGIGNRMFARAIFLTRDTTLLLDPWSRTKVTGFAGAMTERDIEQRLNRMLATLGHREDHPFVVSITRPLGRAAATRPHSAGSASSADSPVSVGSESNGSVFDPSIVPDLTSSDDAPEDGF